MTVPTVSWDETSPAGSDSINLGDNRIRELKTQIREVIDVDHDFPSSGQDAGNGQHKQVTLQEQADLGTGAANATILGSQTVNGKGELVYSDEDDNDVQITNAGVIRLESGRVSNDTYIVGRNNGDSGDINMIKVTTSDQLTLGAVTILPDTSQLTSSAAPAADAQIANKKYVDDNVKTADGTTITDSGGTISVANALIGVEDYGTSASSSTTKNTPDLKIAYGTISVAGSSSQAITNLNFTATGSYAVTAAFGSAQSATEAVEVVKGSASSFTIYNRDNLTQNINWIAVGT